MYQLLWDCNTSVIVDTFACKFYILKESTIKGQKVIK